MREFMLKHPGEIRANVVDSAERNANLSVIQCSGPTRRAGYVEVILPRIEDHFNALARLAAELARQILVCGLKRRKNLFAQGFRTLRAFVVKREMSTLALRKIPFSRGLALRAGDHLLQRCIGTKANRLFPTFNRILTMVSCELSVAQHGVGIR